MAYEPLQYTKEIRDKLLSTPESKAAYEKAHSEYKAINENIKPPPQK